MEKEYNFHHWVPSSKGWLTTKENLIKMEVKDHTRRHSWCGNDTTVEAICRVLLMNEKILTDNFKADLMDVLDRYINNYYVPKTHSGFIKSEVQRVLDTEDGLFPNLK